MNNSHESRLLLWLRDNGIPTITHWYWEETANKARIAHTFAYCTELRHDVQELRADVEELLGEHYLCRTCLLRPLTPNASPDELKELTRSAFAYQGVDRWVTDADSTFHVTIGRTFPSLHGAIVDDVARHLSSELARIDANPVFASLRQRIEARVDALVDAHPYDPRAAMRDAILCAVRWKFRDESAKDLYRRQLKEHHNAVQELQMQFVDLVRRPGDARQAATELRRANDPLATALPELDDILDTWVTSIELAFMRINPRFFVCGGITLNLYSVPRGARDWVVGQGLRAVHHHWGLGELPEIVLEHLTAGQRPNDKQVSVTMLNNEHCTMAVDQWEIANALWSEHRNMRRGEVPYADPAEALRAARSL